MAQDQKPVMLKAADHMRLKIMAAEAGLTMGRLISNLLNVVENRVAYAKKQGIVPKEHPDIINLLMETESLPVELDNIKKDRNGWQHE